ncbi:hypothetical protein TraAM80_00495 [Trypanosoma rangeli]|uniref:Uncharacterized protein n=1 Tax=Trypanosoma rangeli TaxID=5698 RepID=A0A422P2Y6_TRYRA|nr:uncharacterized protein TraAM80_00495 [Trypanosoma rangeli]RNF12078.1 hypothetical protein TraAM80_00495 [Trypanosoma rangeli]|eukprot:RNF12078.1 hypothetical protein TraAM80_00495 [Trypanosoma rangeli]
MLSRVIHDLYYLKRIHSVVLDEKLGRALKAKLSALNLRDSPSPGPAALRRLVECLVYFQLESSPVTVSAIALVREELSQMTGSQLSRTIAACCALGQNDISVSAVSLLAEALPSMDSVGAVQLIQSLATAGVRHEDTWSLLAEHCIRRMDSFTGRQLYRIIECFYERKVQYPDFYVVAERHICAQPSTYISMEQLSGVIECYRGLGLPVMSLLAASSTRSAEGFDSGLVAVAPTRARRVHRDGAGMIAAGGDAPSNHAVMATFLESALKAMKVADDPQLSDMLQKCEAKQVMHVEIMEAAAMRLRELHATSPNVFRTTALIRLMMRFQKKEWFTSAAQPLSQLLDECAESAIPALGHRMLTLADGALKLFPAGVQPTHFYAALVRDLKFDDVAASTDARRLPLLAGVMISLRTYGGHALLEQHMSMISVAAANAPLRVQVELAEMLAPLPAARSAFLPDLFQSLSAERNWVRVLTAREAALLLESLARSRLPFNDLLLVVVEYTRENLGRFDASKLVNMLLQCATMGFSDIEFYSTTATHILEKAPRSNVHDLCLLMYVFTFVLKGVIRVVQQILPRLRVSASHAVPRDITLVLYSAVKLGITRHTEVTTPFCDRAANIIASFKGEELSSCMTSLHALRFDHEGLLSAAAHVLGAELAHREGIVAEKEEGVRLSDAQIVSIASAIVQLRHSLLRTEWHSPLQRICFGCLPTAGPSQTHHIAVTVAALKEAPCQAGQWEKLLQHANAVCQRFPSGTVTAEVLLSLHDFITRDGGVDIREALVASPLLAHAQRNVADVMANTEVRDRLRSKGLLALIAGVGVPLSDDDSDRVSARDIPLRESMLLYHKKLRQTAPHGGPKRIKSQALNPTSIRAAAKSKPMKRKEKDENGVSTHSCGGDRLSKEGAELASGDASASIEDDGDDKAMGAGTSVLASRRAGAKKLSIDYDVEPEADVEEFHI